MAGTSYDSDSDNSLDDDSFIDLYSHLEKSSRRLERRQSREPDPVADSGQETEIRPNRRSSSGSNIPSVEKPHRAPQRLSSSSHDGDKSKSRFPTSRRSTDQPTGMLGSFLANDQSKITSSSKGNRSICSAPALVRRKSNDSVDCGSVSSRKTTHESQRPSEESSRSSRSVSHLRGEPSAPSRSVSRSRVESSSTRSVSRSGGESSRHLRGISRQDASFRGERSSTRSKPDPKDAESLVASKLREIRKGQDEQRRKSQELKRSMSQRQAYRSLRSSSTSRSSRNLTRQQSSGSMNPSNSSTRSSSSTRTSSSPKPSRNSSYLNNLFAPGTQ